MTINIADNSPRISYSVAEGVTQTSFSVPFEFFDEPDLNVYIDGVLQTITTNYTVSGGDGSTGSITMSVTGGTGGSTVVITRAIELERTTDFPVSGAFNIVALNTELDRLVAIAADLDDRASRALQLTDYDASANLTLPDLNSRKGKTLAFNLSTGAVEAGPSITDVQTVSAASADIALLADIQDGTTATNALTNLNTISSDITTVSGIQSDVTTVSTNNANVTTVATDLSGSNNIGTVATNIASINTVATNIADVITVANDLNEAVSEVVTVADDLNEAVSEIDTVAGSITNVDVVGNAITNVNTVATDLSGSNNIGSVATNITNINSVATNATNINTVATDLSGSNNIGSVAGALTNINLVGGDITSVNTVASNLSSINDFADKYRIGSSDPSTDNDTGDLFYNTTTDTLKIYNGTAWEAGVTAGSGFLALTGGTLTGSLGGTSATFSGTLSAADATFTATTSIGVPSGTTAQRPSSPVNGMFRYNTEDGAFEGYVDNAWGAVGGAVDLLDCGTASSQTGTLYDLGSASSA